MIGVEIGDMHGCNWSCIQAYAKGEGRPTSYESRELTKKIKTVVSFVEFYTDKGSDMIESLTGKRFMNKAVVIVGTNYDGSVTAAYSYDAHRFGIATVVLNS